ncbi:MAG: GNAT family N-acetyltransferase [Agriterribacter sp.]
MNIIFTPISNPVSSSIKELYEQAFPPNERRPWNEQLTLIETGRLLAETISIDEAFTGFIFYWKLTDFVFIEHFSIADSNRGKGIGSKIIQLLADRFHTIVLEAEPQETNADAARRIQFYIRSGFELFKEPYEQPPYIPGGPCHAMQLMHLQMDSSKTTFSAVKNEIYGKVYGIK